jgi:transposase-like protein
MKALVALLYSMGGMSYTMLAKIFGVSNGTTYNWVKEVSEMLPELEVADGVKEIEFDEMWHYIGKKNGNCGSSKQWTDVQAR